MENRKFNSRTLLQEWLYKSWDHLAWLGRALWACRISTLSALAGVALFGFAVQAQNLFADRSFAGFFEGVPYWFLVFALVFVAWAFPIHYNGILSFFVQ